MRGAVLNGVPGIEGDCGGSCICTTCHVYINADWTFHTGHPNSMARELLGSIENEVEINERSRLSCPIEVTIALERLVVHLPIKQV